MNIGVIFRYFVCGGGDMFSFRSHLVLQWISIPAFQNISEEITCPHRISLMCIPSAFLWLQRSMLATLIIHVSVKNTAIIYINSYMNYIPWAKNENLVSQIRSSLTQPRYTPGNDNSLHRHWTDINLDRAMFEQIRRTKFSFIDDDIHNKDILTINKANQRKRQC